MTVKHIIAPVIVLLAATAHAQGTLERLPQDRLDVLPPSVRVDGPPGRMHITEKSCPQRSAGDIRRRIVDIAVQEWGFFGFTIVDQTNIPGSEPAWGSRPRRRAPWLDPAESARVADSIAGYWAITPDGAWILSRQNDVWSGYQGVASRWRDPWSAAFISWVMCEAGLGEPNRFRRAIAHHSYIDQAIIARDTGDELAAFVAYDVGERAIEPGDMLCAGRRPAYRTLDERRRQLGVGIRSHCDIVVKVDEDNDRILVIGGNVRGAVSLKLHAAKFATGSDGTGRAVSVGRGRRTVFAHLKLRAESIGADALETTPTIRTIAARDGAAVELQQRLHGESAIRLDRISSEVPVEAQSPADSSL